MSYFELQVVIFGECVSAVTKMAYHEGNINLESQCDENCKLVYVWLIDAGLSGDIFVIVSKSNVMQFLRNLLYCNVCS